MKTIVYKKSLEIVTSKSPIDFKSSSDGGWDRFITVNNVNIFHIGNICGTCEFFFEKTNDIKNALKIKSIVSYLNSGLLSIEEDMVESLQAMLPNGLYKVVLKTIKPRFIVIGKNDDYFQQEQVNLWGIDDYTGMPHSPQVNYYRGKDMMISKNEKLFEFLIPLTSETILNPDRIKYYKDQISSGVRPTCVSISILDIKNPSETIDKGEADVIQSHWCLAHYLIDGHHKIKAASDLDQEITLLSFIAVNKGISNIDDMEKVISINQKD